MTYSLRIRLLAVLTVLAVPLFSIACSDSVDPASDESIAPESEEPVPVSEESVDPVSDESIDPVSEEPVPVSEESVDPVSDESIDPVSEEPVPVSEESVDPVSDESIDPVSEEPVPVSEESVDPVSDESIDPVSEEPVPVSEESVDPVSDESIDPVSDESIDPVSEESVDPVSDESIDPVSDESIDPVSEESVDPVSDESIDPVSDESIDPVSEESEESESATPTPVSTSERVVILDPKLREAIEQSLNKSSGAPIFQHEMETIRSLTASYEDIGDLEGIQFATNLSQLELVEIRGSLILGSGDERYTPLDVSPLANLTNLTRLDLRQNKIADLSPLASLKNLEYLNLSVIHVIWDESDTSTLDLTPLSSLTKLTELDLSHNSISNIAPLVDLIALERLNIRNNDLTDISPLAGLTKLVHLDAQENNIASVSALSGLTDLQEVLLAINDISDVSSLVANTGLGSGDVADIRANPLHPESIHTHIPALQARGVDVSLDEVVISADPWIYNDNVFVLPATEHLAAGPVPVVDYALRFFEYFRDEFDFLMFVPNLPTGEGARYLSVSNDVSGIGVRTFANNATFGSAHKLQGIVDFGTYAIYSGRRSIVFEGPTLHELMHRWGNYVVPTTYSGHWGHSSANGNIGGFNLANLVDHGEGQYTAGHFSIGGVADNVMPYSPIELYLGGFISAEEVPDLWIAEDAEWMRNELGTVAHADNGFPIFTASQVRTYTVEDIIAEHGPRVPDASQARKDFRAAVILIVDQENPATKEILETLSGDVAWFSHAGEDDLGRFNFYEATGGRGTIVMDSLSEFLLRPLP